MRPMSEVAQAILKTANDYSATGRRVTLAELAAGANVGQQAARHTVSNLKRSGALQLVGERKVSYRNRPVAEYAPAPPPASADEPEPVDKSPALGWLDLNACLLGWAR